jgi:hypothetical protein
MMWSMTEIIPFLSALGFTFPTTAQLELRLLPQQSHSSLRTVRCTLLYAADGGDNNDIQDTTTLQTVDELDGQALEEMELEQPPEWMVMKQVQVR